MPESDTERGAREFVQENEELLTEGGPAALERLYLHATELATDLTNESAEAGTAAAEATNALTQAIRNRTTPPARLNRMEREKDRLTEEFKRKTRAVEDFDGFLRRARDAHQSANPGLDAEQ